MWEEHLDYTNYDTRTFSEIFPTDVSFEKFYNECGLPKRLLTSTTEYNYLNYGIRTIYALLIANYANEHIAMYDENRFKFQVMSIIYEAGPAWQRTMAIQDRLLTMSDEIIYKGSRAVYNHAMHPDTDPGTSSPEELTYISDQNTALWTKDNVKGLVEILYSLDDTAVSRFIYRFKKLFQKVAYQNRPPFQYGVNN